MSGDRNERNRELIEKTSALLAADYPLDVLIDQLGIALGDAMLARVSIALDAAGRQWEARVRFSKNVEDGVALTRLDVPLSYGERVLGVMSVTREAEFTRDDLRAVESIARHIALAIRNDRLARAAAGRIRYPWGALGAVGAAVVLLTAMIALWMHATVDAKQNAVSASDRAHARRVADAIIHTFDDDRTVAVIAAARPGIAGAIAAARATDAVERVVISRGSSAAVSYVFLNASFAGAAAPFPGGLAVAELRTGTLARHIAAVLPPGTGAAIVRDDRVLLHAGAEGVREAAVLAIPLDRTPWTLLFAVSQLTMRAQNSQTAIVGAASIGITWIVGLALGAFLHLTYVARRDAARLREQRVELQSEIVSRLDVEEQLRAAAYHDALTALPNRAFFLEQLRDVLGQRERGHAETEYAILFIDLDRFYVVNDSLGHQAGDQLLAAIAYRLEETIPPHALIARLGGDEFVLLLPAAGSAIQEATAIAEDILEALRNPFRMGEREVYSGASIGILEIDASYTDSESILRDADVSMYHAKRAGRAGFAVFDQAMRRRVVQQLELESSLRGAVDRGEIVAFYQPIVRVRDERIVGFEALARWHRFGEDQTVPAGDFVPVAEVTGMMRAIDAELFSQVCRDVAELTSIAPGVRVSVNVSANDLTRASLLADIDATMQRFSVAPDALRIEITETAVMEDAERALAMLAELRSRGLEMVVDDFGAGYSSLSYLQRLPLAGVKIDRSFIGSLPGDAQALEIVRAIVALAQTLGFHVTAEGVERPEQFELLKFLDVEYAQGFFFSQPVDFATAKAFFAVRS